MVIVLASGRNRLLTYQDRTPDLLVVRQHLNLLAHCLGTFQDVVRGFVSGVNKHLESVQLVKFDLNYPHNPSLKLYYKCFGQINVSVTA